MQLSIGKLQLPAPSTVFSPQHLCFIILPASVVAAVIVIVCHLSDWVCDFFAAVIMKPAFVAWLMGCIYCLSLIHLSQAEMFTAIVDLERILHAEYEVAQDLRNYVENEQQRIDTLKR